jgi:hypothetical protein
MNKKIKVTVEYWGSWSAAGAHDYMAVKITGAVNFPAAGKAVRVGDLLSEAELQQAGSNVELTVIPKPK